MKDVVIVSAVRSAIGSFGGGLKDVSAVKLGEVVAKEAILRAGITPDMIDEAIIGNVLGAGLGQNVARQIVIGAGAPYSVPAMTINKVCGSGLRSVTLAAQIIMSGDGDIILAGGTENMSRTPYISNEARWGLRMGNKPMVDYMINDGLWDVFNDYHMGMTAENISKQWNISREEQDEFAASSQIKAAKASQAGKFKDEIVPISIPQRKGDPIIFDTDEYIREGTTAQTLSRLKPAFDREKGSVTAGNASGINDGAAMFIVMSKSKADELGIQPLATIKAYASVGVNPEIMGYGPKLATEKALQKANWTIKDIELAELNEAFAAQSIAVVKDLKINPDIVNVNGGAIALGHPIGCSGARILVTLLHEMEKRDHKKGLASLCIGGGMGISLLVER